MDPKNITILDGAEKIEGLAENFNHLNKKFTLNAEFNCTFGGNYLDTLKTFDMIIITPGISFYHPKIYPYRNKITSQAQMFFEYYQGKIIAVSGTKGKSTTPTLLYETCKRAKKNVQLVGNMGNPVLNYLNVEHLASQKEEYVVFEVSSYMLDGLKKNNYISILLNIYADHIDWHEGFENYKNAKLNLLNGSKYNLVRDEVREKYDFTKQQLKDLHISTFGHRGAYNYQEGQFSIQKKPLFDDASVLLR